MSFEKDLLGVSIQLPNGVRKTIKVGDVLDDIDGFNFGYIVDMLNTEFNEKINGVELTILFENGTQYEKVIRPDLISTWQASGAEQWNNFKIDNLEISEGILLEREVAREEAEKAEEEKQRESLMPK